MHALTIHQPWASLIVAGIKPVENRSWTTDYRGPLAIHAGRSRETLLGDDEPLARELAAKGVRKAVQRTARPIENSIYPGLPAYLADGDPDALPFGAVLGVVELAAIWPIDDPRLDDGRYKRFRGWATGPWCWILDRPRVYRPPVPASGQQRLWAWDEPPRPTFDKA